MSKVAFKAGSSQHGNARRASVDSNWVVAANLSSPSCVYFDLEKLGKTCKVKG